ncbi:glycosyl transferase group 1 [Alkalidesulfovibrio alkalitolerans DSM 16529]|uniref:Glycosyl transferase group 1 n=1 Tax=Alkalidesulfovibrio alkalitolerans DSM 16529 TaxID=1121439 RepID=S7T0H2_9BACT|nr:glycosyltransferase family 4 protein [Alkalidesulfovibrio alkalitolerans]EPR30577.1 glycosyl transferase group 1 [Alkalidesulfovibrio alkalitolerans DSM 16529]
MRKPRRLLTVARWPLGGIRTYMRYVYGRLGGDWRVTILAADTQESAALREDAAALGAELILSRPTAASFVSRIARTLAERRHDLIQSQGFISAIAACLANVPFKKPHVLTVHGVLEERFLRGVRGRLKRLATNTAIRSVDTVYGVGQDILDHLREEVPGLAGSRARQVAILNGIEPEMFLDPGNPGAFRARNDLSPDVFLFGFLGRFMPQKGFNKIIAALAKLSADGAAKRDYRLVAVGSGDYLDWYRKTAHEQGVAERIVFLPFQRDVAEVYRDLDAVVMPSNWEACPLQPMEALVSGVPLIVSDCIGLREVVRDTPAIVVPGGEPEGLARAMDELLSGHGSEAFADFRHEAARRFDVGRTAESVKRLFDDMAGRA